MIFEVHGDIFFSNSSIREHLTHLIELLILSEMLNHLPDDIFLGNVVNNNWVLLSYLLYQVVL